MLFGRRKPGYTTTVDGSVDPEQAVLELQKAELAAKKKPKAEVFDIDAASETARRLKETGSTFDGSAAKTGEDVIAAVERETAELAAKQAAEAAPEAAEAAQPNAAKPELLDFLASEPEAENDPFADQPTKTAPELPELTPAQELAGYIRARSAAALITPHALLLEEVENADELLAQMPTDPQCTDIVTRAGAKDTYYYSNANMSDNYAMIAQLIEDKDLCVMFAEMVRFNARIYPSVLPALPLRPCTGGHRADLEGHAGEPGVCRYRGADQQPERAVPLFHQAPHPPLRQGYQRRGRFLRLNQPTIESGYKSFFEQRRLNSHKEQDTAPQCCTRKGGHSRVAGETPPPSRRRNAAI